MTLRDSFAIGAIWLVASVFAAVLIFAGIALTATVTVLVWGVIT